MAVGEGLLKRCQPQLFAGGPGGGRGQDRDRNQPVSYHALPCILDPRNTELFQVLSIFHAIPCPHAFVLAIPFPQDALLIFLTLLVITIQD